MPLKSRSTPSKNKHTSPFSVYLALTFLIVVLGCNAIGRIPTEIVYFYLLMSFVSFIIYAFDKSKSKKGGRRIPEKTLHLLAIAGGWPGAIFAQQSLRHKTQKKEFRFVFWITVIVNIIGFTWFFFVRS